MLAAFSEPRGLLLRACAGSPKRPAWGRGRGPYSPTGCDQPARNGPRSRRAARDHGRSRQDAYKAGHAALRASGWSGVRSVRSRPTNRTHNRTNRTNRRSYRRAYRHAPRAAAGRAPGPRRGKAYHRRPGREDTARNRIARGGRGCLRGCIAPARSGRGSGGRTEAVVA